MIARWLVAMSLLGGAVSVIGQPPATPKDKENAATAYRNAWKRIDAGLSDAAASVTFEASGLTVAPEAKVKSADEIKKRLGAAQPVVKDLLHAGTMSHSDFGLRTGKHTSQAEQPALVGLCASIRGSARLLRADAARAWSEGDIDGAVDRIAAIHAMSAHVSGEPVVIVAMANSAVIGLANETARTMAAGGSGKSLNPAQRKKLLDALNRLDRADPSGLARARKSEGDPDAKTGQSHDAAQARLAADLDTTRRALK
jgi:hypothetical protein